MEIPDAEPGGLVIEVTMAGVCGTDAHLVRGSVPLPLPMVLGHEGVGTIAELGADTLTDTAGTPVQVGDRVYWGPMRPCHHCYYCSIEGDLTSCENPAWPVPAHIPSAATYGQYAWLPAGSMFFRIPEETPSEAVIAFGCGLPSAMQGIDRMGGISPRDTVVIQGCGPVGIAATLLAHRAGAARIIVIGAPRHRLDVAEKFGATATISLDDFDADERARQVSDYTDGGPTVVIEAAGHISAFTEGVTMVRRNGRYLVLGLWADQGTIPIAPHYINNMNLRLVGSQFAQPEHFYRSLSLVSQTHKTFPFAEAVTHRYSLEQTMDALDAVVRAETLKAVVEPNRLS